MSIISIRPATLDDASNLTSLMEQLGYKMDIFKIQERLRAYTKPMHYVLLAESNNDIIGLIAIACYEHFVIEGRCMHIEALVVDESYRGLGIGNKLMTAAENYAHENNCVTIELITLNNRKDAGTHNFYEKYFF